MHTTMNVAALLTAALLWHHQPTWERSALKVTLTSHVRMPMTSRVYWASGLKVGRVEWKMVAQYME
jgi:hypothetical protein